jgi:hypothetical protein
VPTVIRYRGFRLFFYSNEGSEPPHIHGEHGESTAKFWLTPVECANSQGFSARDLAKAAKIILAQKRVIEEAWHEHFDA